MFAPLLHALPDANDLSRPGRVRVATTGRGTAFVLAFSRALGLPAHCVRDGGLELCWQDGLDVTVAVTPWDQVTVMALLGCADELSAPQWLALTTQTSDLSPWPWAGHLVVHDGQLWLNWAAPADVAIDEAVEHALSFLGVATDARARLQA